MWFRITCYRWRCPWWCLRCGITIWAVWPYLALMGICFGIYFPGFTALWPELYGARHLGAIKSLTTAINVFSTALGPAFMGTLLSLGIPRSLS